MMEKIKKAIGILDRYLVNDSLFTDYEKNALPCLLDLAQKVVDVGGVMPEKRKTIHDEDSIHYESYPYCPSCGLSENFCNCPGFNEAIDQCTLAVAGGWVRKLDLPSADMAIKYLQNVIQYENLSYGGIKSINDAINIIKQSHRERRMKC